MTALAAPPALSAAGTPRFARVAAALGFLLIVTQRLGVTISDAQLGRLVIPITVVLILAALFVGLVFARVHIAPSGLLAFVGLVAAAVVSSLAARSPSLPSLMLFLATYAVALIDYRSLVGFGRSFFDGVLLAIKLGAVLALLQYGWQALGRGYVDAMQLLPAGLLRDDFNTYYAVQGGFKPNGMIFLEPSLLSLYCSIGIVLLLTMVVQQHEHVWRNALWIVLLTGGLAVSASTSGLVVLGAAALPLLFMLRRKPWVLLAILAGLLAFWATGLFDSLIIKSTESWTGNTSTALRLYYPYVLLTPYWLDSPLFGLGPGTVSDVIGQIGFWSGLQATTTMKLLVEYGAFGAIALFVIVARALYHNKAPLPLVFGIGAAWLFILESLVNGILVVMLILALPTWTAARNNLVAPPSGRSRPRAGDRAPSP